MIFGKDNSKKSLFVLSQPARPVSAVRLWREPDVVLLIGPGIRQRLGEAADSEIRRHGAVNDRGDDAGETKASVARVRMCRSP